MYTVMVHSVSDTNGVSFYKISYTGSSIETFMKRSKWDGELIWSKELATETEAKLFKEEYKALIPDRYQSELIASKADTFQIDELPSPGEVDIDKEKLEEAIKKLSEPVFVYLVKLDDDWAKSGTSIEDPRTNSKLAGLEFFWCFKIVEGKAKAEAIRDFVYSSCSLKRTNKHHGLFKKAFVPLVMAKDALAVNKAFKEASIPRKDVIEPALAWDN